MAFFVFGVGMLLLKLAGVGFMAPVGWWWVALPFGLAVLWWAIADATGLTQRRLMAQQAARAQARRERQYEEMGLRVPPPGSPRSGPRKRD